MTPAVVGKYSRAKVVLPAPLGPAITMQIGAFRSRLLTLADTKLEQTKMQDTKEKMG